MTYKERNFPYVDFKDRLAECFEESLRSEGIGHLSKELIDLHLDDRMQAMPDMASSVQQEMILELNNGEQFSDILSKIKLEDASTKEGMFRLLVRTRLNSSGINNVSRGNVDGGKTRSPRILRFIETLDLGHCYSPEELVNLWLEYAEDANSTVMAGSQYEERDIAALRLLRKALNYSSADESIAQRLSAPNLNRIYNSDKKIRGFFGWVAIVASVFSGLRFLQRSDWDIYTRATSNQRMSYVEVDHVTRTVEENVVGFGYALAGSYLADMGDTNFVKDDTHVRAFVNSVAPELRKPDGRVNYVISQSSRWGVSPRALDKLLYLAGSGHLPLLGIKIKDADRMKKLMLEVLR